METTKRHQRDLVTFAPNPMTPNPTTPAPTEEERADYLLKCNTYLNAHVRDLSEQLRKECWALSRTEERCAELELDAASLTDFMNTCARECSVTEATKVNPEEMKSLFGRLWDKISVYRSRAESAEAQLDRMKAVLEEAKEFALECESAEDRSNLDGDDAETVLLQINEAAERLTDIVRAALATPPAEEKP